MTPATAPNETAAAREARIERVVRIGKALSHRVRIEILLCFDASGRPTSPPQMSAAGVAPEASNPHLNYHVGELRKAGCLHEVGSTQVRGARESFYVLRPFGREVVDIIKAEGR